MPTNDLRRYFETNSGRLIHKWLHYFDIYERHFSRFRGRKIKMLEIGVFHGGSLQMWKDYFGPDALIVGVDINPICRNFAEPGIEIQIGDQSNRQFLRGLADRYGDFDIVLDDGGHTAPQQIATFEELFARITENGVYLCEDLLTSYRLSFDGGLRRPGTFIEYAKNLIDRLNAFHSQEPTGFAPDDFTSSADSLHFYDSVLVIEKKLRAKPEHRKTGQPMW